MRKLGVNIDHVATLRQARKEGIPDLMLAARETAAAGADSITIHLREDRRHINDEDAFSLIAYGPLPINLEMSLADEIVDIACNLKPRSSCLVPEKRQELTTEGGLDVISNYDRLKIAVERLKAESIEVSLFIDPDPEQIKLASELEVFAVELHTGSYANASGQEKNQELDKIKKAALQAADAGLHVHAGHGLDYDNVQAVAEIKEIVEFNIGYSIICQSIFDGLRKSVHRMKSLIE